MAVKSASLIHASASARVDRVQQRTVGSDAAHRKAKDMFTQSYSAAK